jgi:hypothetical protein
MAVIAARRFVSPSIHWIDIKRIPFDANDAPLSYRCSQVHFMTGQGEVLPFILSHAYVAFMQHRIGRHNAQGVFGDIDIDGDGAQHLTNTIGSGLRRNVQSITSVQC